ncbi:hypothetical protein [Rhizobium sp. Leaf262]|uniref:hypothetical protein n=1 Tax=Rhizobium sp. Leaf262 TaxID=1736312 RepID=UPI000AC838E4|nr:hypothetical protein [Rhizobium sp. Leaf262]
MQTQNDTEMKTFTVDRDDNRPPCFTGTRLAGPQSSSDRGSSDYSGQLGFREILKLYQSQRCDYSATRTIATQGRAKIPPRRSYRQAKTPSSNSSALDGDGDLCRGRMGYR